MTPDEMAAERHHLHKVMETAECILGRPGYIITSGGESIVDDDGYLRLFVGPRASGKTTRQSVEITKMMIAYGGSSGVYVAPTRESLRSFIFPSICRVTPAGDLEGGSYVGATDLGRLTIQYRNGSRIRGMTFAEMMELRGAWPVNMVAIDELLCAASQARRIMTSAFKIARRRFGATRHPVIVAGVGTVPDWLKHMRCAAIEPVSRQPDQA